MRWRRKWQPTPVFLPGESQGRWSLVGCHLWGRIEPDTTEAGQEATIITGHGTTDWLKIGKGVQQGCILSVQFSSVSQSRPTLCDPMDCSMPGFPVHHQLPELYQIHVHRVGDAIQPSHPLLSPSPPALNLSQHQVFSNESVFCIRWPKYWSLSISPSNEYSGLIFFRMD